MRPPLLPHLGTSAKFALAAFLLFVITQSAVAQSTDISYPAPVFSNEIIARIPPRDLGDSRQTRHFYTFKGTEGDITFTVESSGLSGDVDIFMAKTLRPLLKVTLFGGTTTKATKSVYLRREETLILRVEARAVGDTDGGYRILLGGSFAPAPPDLAQAPDLSNPSTEPTERKGTRRVTATGARIEEPPAEIAEATPTPTPEASPAETSTETKPAPTRTPSRSRRGRNTRSNTSRSRNPAPATTPAEPTSGTETAANDTPKPEAEKPESSATPSSEKAPPATSRRRGSRTSNRRAPSPAPKPEESAGSTVPPPPAPTVTILRLVIVKKDGEILEHDLSKVRRFTVENNQIVVTMKDGKVVKTPLAIVEKMSFEP